jgi:hypothetical protein
VARPIEAPLRTRCALQLRGASERSFGICPRDLSLSDFGGSACMNRRQPATAGGCVCKMRSQSSRSRALLPANSQMSAERRIVAAGTTGACQSGRALPGLSNRQGLLNDTRGFDQPSRRLHVSSLRFAGKDVAPVRVHVEASAGESWFESLAEQGSTRRNALSGLTATSSVALPCWRRRATRVGCIRSFGGTGR